MSYFGYKRGDISKEGSPDIAAIGTALATGIDTETKRRKDLKTKLEDENRTSLEKLGEFAKTEDISSNEFLYNGAAAGRAEQTAIHQAMLDGKINVEDANRAKLNVMGSWKGLKENVAGIAKRIEDLSKLDGKGNSLQAKALIKALDFKNKKIQHDPKTGKGYIIDDKGEKILMESIGNLVGKEFDTVDIDGLTTSMTDDVAVFETYQSSTSSTQDSRQQASFETFMDSQVKTGIPTDQSVYSILMDSAGVESSDGTGKQVPKNIKVTEITGYDKTGNPITKQKEYNISALNLKLNKETGSLEQEGGATEDQRAAAEAIFRSNLEMKLARKSSKQFVRPEKATPGEKKEVSSRKLLRDLFIKGDPSALSQIKEKLGASNVYQKEDNGIPTIFIEKEGKLNKIPLNNLNESFNLMANQLGIGDIIRNKPIVRKGDKYSTSLFEKDKTGFYRDLENTQIKTTTFDADFDKKIRGLTGGAVLDKSGRSTGQAKTMNIPEIKVVFQRGLVDAKIDVDAITVSDSGEIIINKGNAMGEKMLIANGNVASLGTLNKDFTGAKLKQLIEKMPKGSKAY